MRRKLAALVLLAGFVLAVPALAQTGAGAPLPAEPSADEQALVAKAQAALDAKKWPDAEAALNCAGQCAAGTVVLLPCVSVW